MKILICDRLLKGKPHSDWKEGWELHYACNNIGVDCDIAGLDCPIPETEIPLIAKDYDFILVTENYPGREWKWWQWETIKTKKMFWAIDTHLVNYNPWLTASKFDYVGLNNKNDINKFSNFKAFYFPYGVSKRFSEKIAPQKIYDTTFIGSLTGDRKEYLDGFGIKHIMAFGRNYIRAIQESKICFNKSMSYDLNAKNLEILAAGTFLLTNYNEPLFDLVKENSVMPNIFYKDDNELRSKIKYYLGNDGKREVMAKQMQEYILSNHSYENRIKWLLEKINEG